MLNTLSARATFYDIIGYFAPGVIALGIAWFWLVILGGGCLAEMIMETMFKHWIVFAVIGLAVSYVAGHCANSCSSWLLEKYVFAEQFKDAKNWCKRLHEQSPERATVIKRNVDAEFGVEIDKLNSFDMLIRMEEFLPQANMSGFSFLCFYGLCRTMALLSWLGAVPVGIFMGMNWHGGCRAQIGAGVVTAVLLCFVGALFIHQYLRFVRYYYDFLGSTLMFPTKMQKCEKTKTAG